MSQLDLTKIPEYYHRYVNLVGDGDVLSHLDEIKEEHLSFLSGLPAHKHEYRYAENKWTLKEILAHIIDTERIMAYRALCFARNDKTELPGFDQDSYVIHSNANNRLWTDLLRDYSAVRTNTLLLFNGFEDEMWNNIGNANNKQISVHGLAYVIAGHDIHHINIIRERYLF